MSTEKAKVVLSLLIVAVIIGSIGFAALLLKPLQPTEQNQTKSYITSEFETLPTIIIWKPNETMTAVNKTTETYINFYQWTYNYSSEQINKTLLDTWLVNSTYPIKLFESNDTSTAFQYALDQGSYIRLQSNHYILANTLYPKSGDDLNGDGAVLVIPKDFQGKYLIDCENCSSVRIRNFVIDTTRWNQNWYWIGREQK